MYNVVLIGCGHMGSVHLDDIYMMKDICVYGVVDTYAERAEMFAKKYGAKSYDTSYMRYMKDKNTDIIICATYPETHLDILKQCVKYKKHLLCEKPIASNTEDAKEFVSIVKGADIKVQIGYILRFNETYRTVADMIHNGMMTMRLSDGSTAYYEAGWGNTIAAENVKEFIGPLGRIRITERENRADCHEEGDLIELYQYPQNEYKIINVNCKRRPTGAQLIHLIKMIESGVQALPTIDDVYKSLDIAIKTDESLREKYIN